MPVLIAALVGLAVVAIGVYWFLRANPSSLAKRARLGLIVAAGFFILLILLASLEFLPGLIPEFFGLAGVAITALIARGVRRRSAGGFSTPGGSQRTVVHTAFLDAWIDHASGDMGASVHTGRFVGRTLDGLTESELRDLHGECVNDQDTLKILETYFDRRFGAQWRQAGADSRQRARGADPGPRTDMTRDQAYAVLGLKSGAGEDEIRAAHRRLIQRMHPDVGGSADLAARINRAKDVLLGQ
jgi:hypothetical protein